MKRIASAGTSGFTLDNRGKESVAVDLTKPEGQAIVQVCIAAAAAAAAATAALVPVLSWVRRAVASRRAHVGGRQALAAKADVFLTNLLPARLARYQLDYATLKVAGGAGHLHLLHSNIPTLALP